MTILDELKKAVSEYQCDFKKSDMAGVIVSYKNFQDIRTQHPLGLVELSNGDIYLYGLLVINILYVLMIKPTLSIRMW